MLDGILTIKITFKRLLPYKLQYEDFLGHKLQQYGDLFLLGATMGDISAIWRFIFIWGNRGYLPAVTCSRS